MADADGDDVRCRWAYPYLRECGGVCQNFPALLNYGNVCCYKESNNSEILIFQISFQCTLIYRAYTTPPGWYAVAIQVEDYPQTTSYIPLSKIPIQFLVFVPNSYGNCNYRPQLAGETLPDGSCHPVSLGSTWSARIVARNQFSG